jgi:putative hydrolase of the HAD superfamily
MKNGIRLVCFDLGGVVVRICRSWAEGCRAAGLDVRGDVDGICAGPNGWPELNGAYQCGRISTDAFACRFSDMVGGLYAPEEILRVHRAWTLAEYRGVGALIDRVHEAGVETAVLSNTCEDHWAILHELPAFRALRNRHGSHELGLCKPDPAIYAALEASVGFSGAEVVFFDDLEENVRAARGCGWDAVQVDHAGEPAAQMAAALVERGLLV